MPVEKRVKKLLWLAVLAGLMTYDRLRYRGSLTDPLLLPLPRILVLLVLGTITAEWWYEPVVRRPLRTLLRWSRGDEHFRPRGGPEERLGGSSERLESVKRIVLWLVVLMLLIRWVATEWKHFYDPAFRPLYFVLLWLFIVALCALVLYRPNPSGPWLLRPGGRYKFRVVSHGLSLTLYGLVFALLFYLVDPSFGLAPYTLLGSLASGTTGIVVAHHSTRRWRLELERQASSSVEIGARVLVDRETFCLIFFVLALLALVIPDAWLNVWGRTWSLALAAVSSFDIAQGIYVWFWGSRREAEGLKPFVISVRQR